MHSCRGDSQRCGVVLGSNRLAFHLTVVPERTLHTLLPLEGALGAHQTVEHLVVGQVAPGMIEEFLLFALDSVENGDRMVRHTVVVTPHHRGIVSIRTNHGDLLRILLQGENIILVLQEHDGLAGHIDGCLSMFLARHLRIRNLRPLHQRRIVHLTEVETTFQQTDHMLIHFFFGDKATTHGFRNALVSIPKTTLHVSTSYGSFGRSMYG